MDFMRWMMPVRRAQTSRRPAWLQPRGLAWYRRPSPWWMQPLLFLAAEATAMIAPALIELIGQMVCKPAYPRTVAAGAERDCLSPGVLADSAAF